MLFGPSFQVRSQLARVILFGLWVITAAAIVAKPVPLPVAAAGVVSLLVLIVWGPLDLTVARFWGVAYAALVAAVYLGTVLNAWTRPRVAALLVLACLAAYAQLLRQEAAPAFYALGAALAGAAVVTRVAARVRAASGVSAQASVLARRAIAGGLLLIFATGAVIPLERWCLAIAWGTPFSETAITGHGAGWPMYLSLGYVSNPYNIAWRDPIGEVHSQLINPSLYAGHPEFQQTLMREYERIAIAAPWLVIRNVLARAGRVHELARHAVQQRLRRYRDADQDEQRAVDLGRHGLDAEQFGWRIMRHARGHQRQQQRGKAMRGGQHFAAMADAAIENPHQHRACNEREREQAKHIARFDAAKRLDLHQPRTSPQSAQHQRGRQRDQRQRDQAAKRTRQADTQHLGHLRQRRGIIGVRSRLFRNQCKHGHRHHGAESSGDPESRAPSPELDDESQRACRQQHADIADRQNDPRPQAEARR